ncbi:MAG: hypothetical protein AAGI25_16560 [Bacteroidota bacterium]
MVQSANPTTYIDENDLPFYIQVGDKDPLVPFLQSQEFANELLEVLGKKRVKFDILGGAKHGGSHFNREENLNKVIEVGT